MKKTIILMLVVLMTLSGCSIKQINDNIMGAVSGEDKVMQPEGQTDMGTVIEGDGISENLTESVSVDNDINENVSESDVKRIDNKNVVIKGIGDSFLGFVKYDEKLFDGTIERNVRGTEGVTYTLKSVNIYENIEESGIIPNNTIINKDGEIEDYVKSRDEIADFIVAEMIATYDKPAGGEDKVVVYTSGDLRPAYFEDNLNEGFYDRIHSGKINNNPDYIWFEVDEDHRVKIDNDSGKNLYNFYVSDGEEVTFRVGIFVPKELIETKNIYLCVNWFPYAYFREYNHKYFALFPQE